MVCSISDTFHRKFYFSVESSNIDWLIPVIDHCFICLILILLKTCGACWGFVCHYPSFYLNMVTLLFGGYSLKSSLSLLGKGQNERFGQYFIFHRENRSEIPFSSLLETNINKLTCLNVLLWLCVLKYALFGFFVWLFTAFSYRLLFAWYVVCFTWSNRQKPLGGHTRAYRLSIQQCPVRKFRYTSVLLIWSSSSQFCRQVQTLSFTLSLRK